MRILLWHLHGAYTTSLVQGGHVYLVPVVPGHGPYGRGRAITPLWPPNAVEVSPEDLRDQDIDVVVLQRPHELTLAAQWLGRRPGVDVPAVYLEHDTPCGAAVTTRHPMAEQRVIPIVHVTHFNALVWDNGIAPVAVIEQGIIDPGDRYTGEIEAAGVVVNEPVRRGRAVGTDLLPGILEVAPVDVFGIAADRLHDAVPAPEGRLGTYPGLTQEQLHARLARRRVYLHLNRWTSIGLSLIEAMHLGMPVVVLGCTEAPFAVPPAAGCVSVRPAELADAVARFLGDADAARSAGAAARDAALSHYGLKRFLDDWDAVLTGVA
jgi:hypothetical protein